MKFHWLAPCTHLIFVVDRIEPPYAIVEWSHSATFEEVPQSRFPRVPNEGQVWTIHIAKNPQIDAVLDTGQPWHSIEFSAEPQPYKLRLSNPSKMRSTH